MAGYVLAKFFNGSMPSGTTTLLTVPAGHKYLIKQITTRVVHTAVNQEVSIKANARIAAKYDSNGTSEHIAAFCSPSDTVVAGSGVTFQGSADNLVLEAGDTLSVTNNSPNTGTVIVSGIDYTI